MRTRASPSPPLGERGSGFQGVNSLATVARPPGEGEFARAEVRGSDARLGWGG